MNEMDLRQYDPAIARWVVQDPVVHHNFSPYSAFDNNPAYWADPSGADAVSGKGNSIDIDGLLHSSKNGDSYSIVNGKLSFNGNVENILKQFYSFESNGEGSGRGGNGNGKEKGDKGFNNNSFKVALGTTFILVGDDATAIGVFDDPLIPIVWAGATGIWLYDNRVLLQKQITEINKLLKKDLHMN